MPAQVSRDAQPGFPGRRLPAHVCGPASSAHLHFFVPNCDFSLLPLEGILGSGDEPENLTEGL